MEEAAAGTRTEGGLSWNLRRSPLALVPPNTVWTVRVAFGWKCNSSAALRQREERVSAMIGNPSAHGSCRWPPPRQRGALGTWVEICVASSRVGEMAKISI